MLLASPALLGWRERWKLINLVRTTIWFASRKLRPTTLVIRA
jgi:hypothetical protein